MILGSFGCKQPLSIIRHELKTDINGSSIYAIITTAKKYGLKGEALCGSFEEFISEIEENNISFPMIVNIRSDNGYSHFVVVNKYKKGRFYISDPAQKCSLKKSEFLEKRWIGNIICFTGFENIKQIDNTSGRMDKYIHICKKQYKTILLAAAISLFISMVGLLGSMMFEYVVNGIYSESFIDGNFNLSKENGETIDVIILNFLIELMPSFIVLVLFVISLYLLQSGLSIFRSFILAKMSKRINIPILITFFEHITKIPFDFFCGRKTGDIITRFSDASSVGQNISNVILSAIIDGILAIAYGLFLFMLSPELFIIVFINLIFYGAIIFLFRNKLKNNRMECLNKDAEVNTFLKESVVGIKTVKQFRYEDIMTNKIFSKFDELMNKSIEGNMMASIQSSLVGFIASSSIIMLLGCGLWLCVKGKMFVGSLMTFYVMMGAFIAPVQRLLELQPEIQAIKVSTERLEDAFALKRESIYNENDDENKFSYSIDSLNFSKMTYAYGYSEPTLDNLELEIRKGEKIAILGKNGCGKTTFANVVTGLLYPKTVNISLNNKILSFEEYKKITGKISYIPQESFLFSDTIYNNLTYGLKTIDEDKLNMYLQKCNLCDYINSLPNGIYTLLEENGENLSSGTKQKMSIVRALMKEPEIIILDEATSNVDRESEEDIYELLESMKNDIAIIDISHKIYDYSVYDNVFDMINGKLRCHASYEKYNR